MIEIIQYNRHGKIVRRDPLSEAPGIAYGIRDDAAKLPVGGGFLRPNWCMTPVETVTLIEARNWGNQEPTT